MTDQTVPVPVDLLKRIEDEVFYGSNSPLKELRGYIPTPPKVGDILTAVQVYDLPPRSTFVDEDEDVYLVYAPRKIKRLTSTYDPGTFFTDEMFEADAPYGSYNELRVTFVPGSAQTV